MEKGNNQMEKLDIFQTNHPQLENFPMFDDFAMKEAKSLIDNYLIDIGVDCAFLVDMIGNIIVQCDDGCFDTEYYIACRVSICQFGSGKHHCRNNR